MSIKVAQFLDVASGLQPKQFSVGSHDQISSLDDLDPIYKKLLDDPVACVLGIVGNDGLVNQTVMWFDYSGSQVLINVAAQRKKCEWIRKSAKASVLLVNPQNAYHPAEGADVTAQLDRAWTKYTQSPPPYGLRDPSINERRVLFVFDVDRVATFGKP
jgi:general stress protein 26